MTTRRKKVKLTDDALILRAVTIDKQIAVLTAERREIHELLQTCFPGVKGTEMIVTAHGVATRKRSTSYRLSADRIQLLRTLLGAEFSLMVRDNGETYVPHDHLTQVEMALHEVGLKPDDILARRAKWACTPALLARFRATPKLLEELVSANILSVETTTSLSISPAA